MAHNAPYGARSDSQLALPVARWQAGGRLAESIPRLPLPHALQESNLPRQCGEPRPMRAG